MKNNHTWKTIKEKVVYNGKVLKIYKDDVIFPSGISGQFEYLKKHPFIAVIAITDKNKIVLVGQYRNSVKKFSWEVPEGSINKGETPLQSAKKELEEEAGLKAKDWKCIGKFVVGAGSFNQWCHTYIAKNLTLGKQSPESSGEMQEVKIVSISQLDKMIRFLKVRPWLLYT